MTAGLTPCARWGCARGPAAVRSHGGHLWAGGCHPPAGAAGPGLCQSPAPAQGPQVGWNSSVCSRELPAGVPSTLENKAGGALKSLKLLTEGRDKVPQTAASVSGPCVLPGGSATVPQSVWGGAWHQVLLEKQVMWCGLPGVLLSPCATGIQLVLSPLLLTAGMVILPNIPELVVFPCNYCYHNLLLCLLCHLMAQYMDVVLGFGILVRFFLGWDYEPL